MEWIWGVLALYRCGCVLRRCPARAVEAYQSVLPYGMSHDGTVVAVVPVLVIRMLTTDNQRCAAALECYQEAPELSGARCGARRGAKGSAAYAGRGARSHPALNQRGGRGVPRSQAERCFPCGGARRRQRKINSRACSPSRRLCIDRTSGDLLHGGTATSQATSRREFSTP